MNETVKLDDLDTYNNLSRKSSSTELKVTENNLNLIIQILKESKKIIIRLKLEYQAFKASSSSNRSENSNNSSGGNELVSENDAFLTYLDELLDGLVNSENILQDNKQNLDIILRNNEVIVQNLQKMEVLKQQVMQTQTNVLDNVRRANLTLTQ